MTAPGSAPGAGAVTPGAAAVDLGPATLGGAPFRAMAAGAAIAVALAGRGDLLFLGGLLAIALANRRASVAALLAAVAVAVRWGGTSAETMTGAITTLGPAVRLGPPLAAMALVLAAVALLLAALGAPLLPRLAVAVTAAAALVGPVGGSSFGAVALGVLAAAAAAVVAVLLPRWVPAPSERLRTAAPVLAAAALALAAIW